MPKPQLFKEDAILESEVISTLLGGLKEWRSDLSYPLSHSDMQACVRGLLKMYEVKRRPVANYLRIGCYECKELGEFIRLEDMIRYTIVCKRCDGRGWFEGK